MLRVLFWCFCGTAGSGSRSDSDFLPALGTLLFLLGCFVQSQNEEICLISHYILFRCVWLWSFGGSSFLKGKGGVVKIVKKGDFVEPEGLERRETSLEILCEK